jgi:DUF4097 and DUF4098 domain-containing protein YvlB
MPRRANLTLRTSGGHLEVGDLEGALTARTAGGHIEAGKYSGALTLKTAGGHIKAVSSGGPATLNTAGGHIEIGDVNGNLEAKTAGGHISTGRVRGNVAAKTAGGHIDIEEAAGSIQAETVGGGVKARFAGQPKGDSMLKTMAGTVNVELPSDIKLDIDADSSGGSVYSAFDLTGTVKQERRRSSFTGQLNGGGPKLTLRTTHGSIRLNRAAL